MATETFSFTYDAGATLRVGFFRLSDGKVLDFGGSPTNTFRTLSGSTTPYTTATELTDPAGTGKSVYAASLDLSLLNSTTTPAVFVVDWYTDTGLTARVSQSLQFKVASSVLCTEAASIQPGAIVDASFTVPTVTGPATGILGFITQLWRRFFWKTAYDGTNLKTYASDDTTVVTTQTISETGSTQTQGKAS